MVETNDYQLRPAVRGDLVRILEFWTAAAENSGRPSDDTAAVARLLDRDPDALVIAESDGVIVGSLISGWDGWRFHLYRLAVLPSWRGRGVARTLLDQAEQRCAAVGGRRVDAMVLDENDTGVGFWRATGYDRQDDWRRWVKTPDA